MLNCILVGAGGFIGSVLRYLIGLIPINGSGFPYKTLIINIVGSFIISAVSVLALKSRGIDPKIVLMLKTGLCGGFTTFSSFALETGTLIHSGSHTAALCYVVFSVAGGVAAIFAAEALLA